MRYSTFHHRSHENWLQYRVYSASKPCLAYRQMKKEGVVGDSEYEMCDMPSGAAMATQEITYEAIPT